MHIARPQPQTPVRRRFMTLPLVLLLAMAIIVPATADDGHPGWLSVSITPDIDAPVFVDGVVRNTGNLHSLELSPGEYQVSFGHVSGYVTPNPETVLVTSNATTELDAEYVEAGVLKVEVAPNGIKPLITVNGLARDSGSTQVSLPAGNATICGDPIAGYDTPSCEDVNVGPGSTTQVTLTYAAVTEPQPEPEAPEIDGRVSDGLVALYDFTDGSGSTITDRAKVLGGMDLTIDDTTATSWSNSSLTINAPTIAATTNAPTDLHQRIQQTGEFTIEAWIEAENVTQRGPARIFSLVGSKTEHLMVGQGNHTGDADLIEARVAGSDHPTARLLTPRGSFTTDLVQVVVTRNSSGDTATFLDGERVATGSAPHDVGQWSSSLTLALGDSTSDDRPWLGTYHLVALYDTALDHQQIGTNHTAGPGVDRSTAEPDPAPQPEPEPEPDPEPTPEPDPAPEPPASWQKAWDTRNYDIIRAWYRENTGIAAAGLTKADLMPSDSFSTTHDGQVIEGLLVSGRIGINHDNVTIRNTKVVNDGGTRAIDIGWGSRDRVDTLTLENVSLIGTGGASEYVQAVAASFAGLHHDTPTPNVGLRASRVYISGFGGGFRLSHFGDDRVDLSIVENIRTHSGSHNTGASFNGGDGKSITRTWIEGSTSSALSLYPDKAPITNFTARENLFDGGTYSTWAGYLKTYKDENHHIRYVDNLFTDRYQYGPVAGFNASQPGSVWTGNSHLDGSPAG